jgi:predicted nuclease of restriction endonuclease-like (RecB) superfamily
MAVEKRQQPYEELLRQISDTYTDGQRRVAQAVNTHLLETYWQIGQYIVEFEQEGASKAEYGKALLENLSKYLSQLHGKGFSRSNLVYMRLFYQKYPISEKPSHQLSCRAAGRSHYVELLKIDDPLERSFYEKQSIAEGWSIPELRRQKKASLYLRLAASKDKEGILRLAQEGQLVEKPTDLLREPYVLEFLKIPEPYHLSESELEKRLIEHLQHFLLELGKGFAFIGRQYRITLGNRHHYVDLVFYHPILKCFVLIDLKKTDRRPEEASYEDVGQMKRSAAHMYLGYFEEEENTTGDNPPIGIVLAREKDDLLIKYALHGISTQLFVNKYQLYLPDKEELRKEVAKIYTEDENGAS